MRRELSLLLPAFALAALSSCSQLVRYTDEIVDPRSGRAAYVTVPATAGGFVGFVLGLPVDVVALPVTGTIYWVQSSQERVKADPLSTMLFPSFALWRLGTLLALPFDAVDYIVRRARQEPPTPREEEQEAIEDDFDQNTLPDYPVVPIYPIPDSAKLSPGV